MSMITTENCHRGVFSIDDPLPGYAFPTTVSCEPLSDRLWTATDGIYRTIFAEGDEGIVAFDTFWSPAAAASYRTALTRVLPDREIHTVVYSHDHLDHTGFASDFAPEASTVLAHEETARVIEARGSDGQTVPTTTWSGERARVKVDGIEFELINPGPTHGSGNAAAWFPEAGVLFMVDTVIPGVSYTFAPDWHLNRYLGSMRRLEELDWDRFVPGHFWPMDRKGFGENLSFYERMGEVARQALADGVDPDHYASVDAYARERLTGEFGRLFRFGEYIGMNLMRFMAHEVTGGWGLEDADGDSKSTLGPATEVTL
ncbi:MBL fold metallo-hydrolase [Kribbella sp. NPDC051620]|uniref:MBL fold metallo-hydrolase n=1 Tax=Kribbella sp. NPDC051620 TaxID=3364120 RepID=UPI0037995DE5